MPFIDLVTQLSFLVAKSRVVELEYML